MVRHSMSWWNVRQNAASARQLVTHTYSGRMDVGRPHSHRDVANLEADKGSTLLGALRYRPHPIEPFPQYRKSRGAIALRCRYALRSATICLEPSAFLVAFALLDLV